MKTYHFKNLLKKEVLIIELPRLCDYHASPRKLWVKDTQSGEELTVKGSWDVLGKPSEIREDDARELVEKVMNGQHFQNYKGRKENDFANLWCKNATESLLSALETDIFWDVNPFKKPNGEDYYYEERHGFDEAELLWDGGSYNEDLSRFEEAESRTFDKSRTLIFVKQ